MKKKFISEKAFNNIYSKNIVKINKPSTKTKNKIEENNEINKTLIINYASTNDHSKFRASLSSIGNNDKNKEEKYYWFATYDKLIKTKKLFKIFSFYNIASKNSIALGNNDLNNEYAKIKEKKLIINDYEIYYIKNMNTKPFIRKSKGKRIYVKLYLLNLKQINMIFSYINKIEYDNYISNMENIREKDNYDNIIKDKDIDIDYPELFCLGSFMNIRIYTFSRLINDNDDIELDLIPNTKKIAKLIKLLLINFPEYSKEYFIDYIFSYIKGTINKDEIQYKILSEKMSEINHLLLSKKKSLYKVSNSGITSVKGIGPIPQEISFSPFLSSFNNNISNKFSSNVYKNTNNNVLNNINGNLGTISYNASCFDFSSDYLNSMRQKDENFNKTLDSIKNLSNQNKDSNNTDTNINNNYNQIKVNKSKTLSRKNKSNNIAVINDKEKGNSKISNFYFEQNSITDKNNFIKINVNKTINYSRNYKNMTYFLNKKEILKNLKRFSIKNLHFFSNTLNFSKISNIRKENSSTSFIKQSSNSDNISYGYTDNPADINMKNSLNTLNNDNKENNKNASNISEKYKNNKPKNKINLNNYIFRFNPSKSPLFKGEDIFPSSDTFTQYNNSSFMYILDENGVNSFDSKNIRRNIISRSMHNQLISKKY